MKTNLPDFKTERELREWLELGNQIWWYVYGGEV